MSRYRVVALEQRTVDEVRASGKAPGYGHPAHVERATGTGPCRLCLEPFRVGEDERVLFTYNPFTDAGAIPCPGPVFVHARSCTRYEAGAFPRSLLAFPLTLEGYDAGGAAVVRSGVTGDAEAAIEDVLSRPAVAFAHVRNTKAGCFIARVERR